MHIPSPTDSPQKLQFKAGELGEQFGEQFGELGVDQLVVPQSSTVAPRSSMQYSCMTTRSFHLHGMTCASLIEWTSAVSTPSNSQGGDFIILHHALNRDVLPV